MEIKLALFVALLGVGFASGLESTRDKRSFGSLFAPTTVSPLSKYPVWKVHKYTGVHLQPVNTPLETSHGEYPAPGEQYAAPREQEVPSVIDVPDPSQADSGDSGDSQAALNALDNLGTLAAFLPDENGQGGGISNVLSSLISGLGRSSSVAEDKVGIISPLSPLKLKKTKSILGLLALSNYLGKGKLGKFSLAKAGGVSGLFKGILGKGAVAKKVPLKSVVYKGVPSGAKGFSFSSFPSLGIFGGSGATTLQLPEPVLPSIPSLELVPEPPALPALNIPGPYNVPYSTGSYLSIRVPKPSEVHDYSPSFQYSPPSTSYGTPVYQPQSEYGVPAYQPQAEYGVPAYQPQTEYGVPAHHPQAEYGVPAHQPQAEYSAPAYQPQTEYGVPAHQPQAQYSAPAYQPQTEYGVPAHQPQTEYGVPAQQPQSEYGVPSQNYVIPQTDALSLPMPYLSPAPEFPTQSQSSQYHPSNGYAPQSSYGPPAAPPAYQYSQHDSYSAHSQSVPNFDHTIPYSASEPQPVIVYPEGRQGMKESEKKDSETSAVQNEKEQEN